MLKMSTERTRLALNGPTMGTRWSAVLYAAPDFDAAPLRQALQAAVDEVDAQMSTWKPDSALMQFNAAPEGASMVLPSHLQAVLRLGLEIGRASGGAFDIGMGDAVTAWGFGPAEAAADAIRRAMTRPRRPAHEVLAFDGDHLCKQGPITLDLNGIAKGYGVDRLAQTLRAHGVTQALVGIDGEMQALGVRPDLSPWSVAIEAPEAGRRAPCSVIALQDAAVATSGDYRHWVNVGGQRLSHTMDPAKGAPVLAAPASVTVVASSCAQADAWATALMVLGVTQGLTLARQRGLDALFLTRGTDGGVIAQGVGPLFQAAGTSP